MPVKKTAKKSEKKAKKKTAAKKPARKKTAVKKGQAFECRVCGYRFIVDNVCGCVEEHLFICCDVPMKQKRASKTS